VGLVELLLAEHSGGHRSEHQLRASLHSLLVPHQQTSNAPQADVQAFSEPRIRQWRKTSPKSCSMLSSEQGAPGAAPRPARLSSRRTRA
jgi:hypothetical protein